MGKNINMPEINKEVKVLVKDGKEVICKLIKFYDMVNNKELYRFQSGNMFFSPEEIISWSEIDNDEKFYIE